MKSILKCDIRTKDVVFSCEVVSGAPLIVDDWALHDVGLPAGRTAVLAPLLGLLEDEIAQVEDNSNLRVPHSSIADLERHELKGLGLPDTMPFGLSIDGEGLLTDRDFQFGYHFVHTDRRPVMGYNRTGSVLAVADSSYIIPNPLYAAIVAMDKYNDTSPEDLEGRFLAWGTIKAHLPENVAVGDYLRSILIVKPDTFTIRPFINAEGYADFDPILLRVQRKEEDDAFGEEIVPENAIPEIPQESFMEQFRTFRDARTRYAVSGGLYVVIPAALQKALSVARTKIDAEPAERRAFISNPRGFLRDELEESFEPELIETLFYESGEYSDRVKDIGIWEPPVLPYISKTNEPWLPPEEIGLRIGDELVQIQAEDVPELIKKAKKALDDGKTFFEYKDHRIPATEQTLEALNTIIAQAQPSKKDPREETKQAKDDKPPIALLIRGNLDEVDYELEPRPGGGQIGSWPSVIKSTPFPHQSHGVSWLQEHWVSGSRGALLADDMGLGKTLQALVLMGWVRDQMDKGEIVRRPMLLVAPTGLLKNWEDEHSQHLFQPGLGESIRVYGSELRDLRLSKAAQRKELEGGLPVLDVSRIRKADWVLTTYETVRDYQHSFGQIHWSLLVFDEVQKIKNPTILMTDAAKAMNADFVLALTGTPVENRLSDLWCILDRVQPGRLGSLRAFSSHYEKGAESHPERLNELKSILTEKTTPPIMLRRMKEDHLKGLPKRHEYPIRKTMPESQARAYETAVEDARRGDKQRGRILKALHAIRSISLHPFQKGEESMEEYINQSARLRITFDTLDKIFEEKAKALVFIESRVMQNTMAEIIQRRYRLKSPPLIINGAVSGPRRKERVDTFQNRPDFDVMLLSPKAGGVGLTLTAANHVIHLSRWWNPAVEDQCSDRVFRIGQNRPVHVYYPMAVHPTFEEQSFDLRLHELLMKKRTLSRTILAPPAGTSKDADELFQQTIEKAQKQPSVSLASIDTMEPIAFEEWILKHYSKEGYRVEHTPRSWDRGADGLAHAPAGSGKPSFIIQCKHTQVDQPCPASAVQEVLNSVSYYSADDTSFQPVVVTNSSRFSSDAIQLAKMENVLLFDRDELGKWV